MGAECHPPGSPPPPASRSPCHKLSTSCQPRAAGRWGGKCSFCAKIKRVWASGDLGEKHRGAAKQDPKGNTHRDLPHAGMARCGLPCCWAQGLGKGPAPICDLSAPGLRVLSAHLAIILIGLLAAARWGGRCLLLTPLISSAGGAPLC